MDVIEMLSQAMELPKGALTGTVVLSEPEAWDSLALLNFMALVDQHLQITLSPGELLRVETVNDISELPERERVGG
jgi:acyl carrier protein